MRIGQFDGDGSSIEAPSTQETLVCIELTSANHHSIQTTEYLCGHEVVIPAVMSPSDSILIDHVYRQEDISGVEITGL